jgi:PAS domain S-box-containing protein
MKLKTIIETCAEPLVVYDKQGLTTYVNPAFEKIFGWKNRELFGKRIDFVPKDQADLTRKAVLRVLEGHTVSGMETQRERKNGEVIHVRLSAAPLKDGGDIDGMVVTLQDITELILSRREALAADTAKAQFLSNVSHEVRTPMNHVMGMIELLLNTRLDDEQQAFVDILQKSADSLMGVLNDVLDYSRIEAGKVDCECIGFDLRTLVEKIETLMAPKAVEKGLKFSLFVHQLVPSLLMGDPGRLRQVLSNLCSNAIKFTQTGDVTLRIDIEQEDDTTAAIRFEIVDTGIGIAPDQTQEIFDSFAQADGSVTRKYGGTGLGLSISTRLVQMMGGSIQLDSILGKGSRFFFTVSFEKQAQEIQREMVVPIAFRDKKILVVDDNITDRRVLKNFILDWGCLFDEASTRETALEKLKAPKNKECPFDIVLLNMDLPGMGGQFLVEKIKTLPKARDLLMVILASVGKKGDVERLKKIGVHGYLPKPIKPQELYDCIATGFAVKNLGLDEMITRHVLRENKKQHVRILLVEQGRVNRKIVLNICGKSGYRIKAKTGTDLAMDAFKTGEYNLILLDMDGSDSQGLIQAIRQNEKQGNKRAVSIIAMTENPRGNENPPGANVEDCLSKPLTPERLLASIETWTWKNEDFLRDHVGGYSRMKSQKKKGIVFNMKAALDRAMDDKAFLEMLVVEFMASLPKRIDAIKKAFLKKDQNALIMAAQSLKGSSANMGADMITSVVQSIEIMGEEGDLGLVEKRITQLVNESGRFKEHVTTIKWDEI